jgi:DNA-binding winged helix-turn-helix (wHTH) protein/predicted ATPase
LIFIFENYVLDTGRRELRGGHTVVSVQPQVFDLLEYLIRNRDHVVSRDDLLDAIWGGRIVSESTLATRINAARSAIGDDGESQRLIRTLPRKGIRFVGEVREVEEEEQPRARRAATSPSGVAATVAPRVEAERRHLTVVSCDFVGLRDLATRLDPEELRTVVGECHACCYQAAARWGGSVARLADDGATIHFSYPQAHEDDAERAVRAGLDLIARIKRLEAGRSIALATRIGIATGLVVLGELSGASGNGTAHDRAAFGQAPALAAALRSVTEPDTVLIAASTHGLLGGLFEYQAVGPLALDGFPSTVPAWLITSAKVAESRFDALHKTKLTPFFGREEELALLLRQWCKARAGEGQVVLISGEPGIGKSRIVAHLAECITEQERYTRLLYQCSPYYRDTSLYPFAAQLEQYAVIASDDPPTRRLDKLEAIVAIRGPGRQSAMPLLAALLAVPTGERYPPITLTPMQQRRQTLAALLDQLEALAQRQPVLLVFEDVHWADPTSIELLDLMVERIRRLAILMLITFRPEFEPSWAGLANVGALTLQRLGRRDVQAIVGGVADGRTLPSEVMEQIVSKADGVPLFVEELTKAILESGLLTKDESSYRLTGPLPLLAIPLTLQDSLMARLDRLGSAKEIAQIGAAIGREFPYELLRAVARIDDIALRDALDRLELAELVSSRGKPPKAAYIFKHALVQDAAYGTLLRGRRQHLHGEITSAIEQAFPEIVEVQPEILARHCAEAGLHEKAQKYWRTAGEHAVRRASNREAIGHFRQALALNEKLPPDIGGSRTELAILSQLGPALMSVHGWSAPEVGVVFERAGDLARQLESSADLAPPLAGLWLFHTARGQFSRADEMTNELFNVARTLDDPDILLQAHHCALGIQWLRGEIRDANAHAEVGLNLYDETRHARHRFLYIGHDPAVCALSLKALFQWLLGYPTQALRLENEAIVSARRLQHAPSLALALRCVCQAQIARNDVTAVMDTATELLSLSEEHGLATPRAVALVCLGWAVGQTKDVAQGVQRLQEGLVAFDRLGQRSTLCVAICLLAETYLANERYESGMEQANRALTISSEIGDQWYLPRIYMIHARLLQQASANAEAAEASLRKALEVAGLQCAKGWELLAATSLARLWCDQGKRDEARNLLAPVYGWFTEGFDTRDLKEAKALLNELAS